MLANKKENGAKTIFKAASSLTKSSVNPQEKMFKMQIKEKMRQKAAAEAMKKASEISLSSSVSALTKENKLSSANHPTPQREAPPQQKPVSPMDTYEISDREDSESDYDSDEERTPSPKKRVSAYSYFSACT